MFFFFFFLNHEHDSPQQVWPEFMDGLLSAWQGSSDGAAAELCMAVLRNLAEVTPHTPNHITELGTLTTDRRRRRRGFTEKKKNIIFFVFTCIVFVYCGCN